MCWITSLPDSSLATDEGAMFSVRTLKVKAWVGARGMQQTAQHRRQRQ
jgi:hypothetical protein